MQAASNYCSPECEAELLALALHGLALRAGTQVQAPQEGVSPPQIQAAGQRAGGARVQKDEIMAPGIVEKAAEEVRRGRGCMASVMVVMLVAGGSVLTIKPRYYALPSQSTGHVDPHMMQGKLLV